MQVISFTKKFFAAFIFVTSLACADVWVWDAGKTDNKTQIQVLMNNPKDLIPFNEKKICLVTQFLYIKEGRRSVAYSSSQGIAVLESDVLFVSNVIKQSFGLWDKALGNLEKTINSKIIKKWRQPKTIDVLINEEVLSYKNASQRSVRVFKRRLDRTAKTF